MTSSSSAVQTLETELKDLQEFPVECFTVTCNDENIFEWNVVVFGPPGTFYQVIFFFHFYIHRVKFSI